jgi:uncharacterized protein (DUF1778 family)
MYNNNNNNNILDFNIRKEIRVKLDKEQWCQHVPKLEETSQDNHVMESASANRQNHP